jgi:hypothetical protein
LINNDKIKKQNGLTKYRIFPLAMKGRTRTATPNCLIWPRKQLGKHSQTAPRGLRDVIGMYAYYFVH